MQKYWCFFHLFFQFWMFKKSILLIKISILKIFLIFFKIGFLGYQVTPIALISKYYRVYSTVGWSQVNPISLCNGEVLHNHFEESIPDTLVVWIKVLYKHFEGGTSLEESECKPAWCYSSYTPTMKGQSINCWDCTSKVYNYVEKQLIDQHYSKVYRTSCVANMCFTMVFNKL